MERMREVDLRGIKEFFVDFGKYLIIGLIVIIMFIYIVSFQQVIGPSMKPNYNEGEIYLLNKLKYKISNPDRFDVVVVDTSSSKYMIKRIVALPGEELEYKDNKLYINGNVVEENFERTGKTNNFNTETFGSLTVPENCYFVLGDNREDSTDSRVFGFVDKKDIVGKVSFRIWPIIK